MSWKSDKERKESSRRSEEESKRKMRELHDMFWGRVKQPKEKHHA